MSFEGLQYDTQTYDQKLRESIGPGMYQLGSPANDCDKCAQDIPTDPYRRWQQWGPGFCAPGKAVDVSSELLGISRKASKCAADQYAPGKGPVAVCQSSGKGSGPECAAQTEPTRYSNPVCTLKDMSNNRWEWLCWNPQDRAIIPFNWNVSNRNVVKDNHAACIPQPIDQTSLLPPAANMQACPPVDWVAVQQRQSSTASVTPTPRSPQQTWQSCKAISSM